MKKLIMLLYGLAVLCLFQSKLQAQARPGSLQGTITDAKTNESIPFANVTIKDSLGNIVTGGASNIDGNYKINPIHPGVYNVEVTFTGYATVKIQDFKIASNKITQQNVKLSPASQELQAVEITYSRPLRRSSSVAASSPSTIAVRDITSVSSQVAGVTRDVKVRGARTEGTVYFINGVKVRGHVNIPQAAIQEVEIITGGLPAQYSSDQERKAVGPPLNKLTTTPEGSAPIVITPAPVARESYSPIKELPFKSVNSAPLSTFSSDVDAASYANFRRFINDGYLPPANAVRIEEMINYFDYDYPQPQKGEVFSMTTELGNCPWRESHQLLRIGIKTRDIPTDDLPDNNLVFLIDVSGSMSSPDKLPLLKKSMKLLVQNLSDKDQVAIVVYASATGMVLNSTKGNKRQEIIDAIENLSAGGSTAGGAGIKLAYKIAAKNFKKSENNRVILATDGDFNVGISSEEGLVKLIEEKRNDGIFLTVLGFGTGNLQDSKMEKLADHGNGNYAYIDNLMEAQKVLVNEMGGTLHTVAKDTKFQIEFNPQQVMAYRLIGYENRMLNDEDFNDDTKDAGDVGAGHSVTAVYEIIPAISDEKLSTPPVDPLKYQQKITLENQAVANELATLKIRYKKPDSDVSELRTQVIAIEDEQTKPSTDFNFICAIMEAGMLLRQSEYAGESNFEQAIELAKAGRGADENGYRGEFVRLVSLAEKLEHTKNVGMR